MIISKRIEEIELEDGTKEMRTIQVDEYGEYMLDLEGRIDNYEMTRPRDPKYLEVVRQFFATKEEWLRMVALQEPIGWLALMYEVPNGNMPREYRDFRAMPYQDALAFLKDVGSYKNEHPEHDLRLDEIIHLIGKLEYSGNGEKPERAWPCVEPRGWCALWYSDTFAYSTRETDHYPQLEAMTYERALSMLRKITTKK